MANTTIITMKDDYERLHDNVLMAKALFEPLAEELYKYAPNHLNKAVGAFCDLLTRIEEDMDNSFTMNEFELN